MNKNPGMTTDDYGDLALVIVLKAAAKRGYVGAKKELRRRAMREATQ